MSDDAWRWLAIYAIFMLALADMHRHAWPSFLPALFSTSLAVHAFAAALVHANVLANRARHRRYTQAAISLVCRVLPVRAARAIAKPGSNDAAWSQTSAIVGMRLVFHVCRFVFGLMWLLFEGRHSLGLSLVPAFALGLVSCRNDKQTSVVLIMLSFLTTTSIYLTSSDDIADRHARGGFGQLLASAMCIEYLDLHLFRTLIHFLATTAAQRHLHLLHGEVWSQVLVPKAVFMALMSVVLCVFGVRGRAVQAVSNPRDHLAVIRLVMPTVVLVVSSLFTPLSTSESNGSHWLIALTVICLANGAHVIANANKGRDHALDTEARSSSFVDHALKQKLVGAGHAIETALAKTPPPSVFQQLQAALVSCRRGADLCHFGSVARMIDQGTYHSKVHSNTLRSAVQVWRTALDPHVSIGICGDAAAQHVRVSVDWDLCYGLVCKGLRHAGQCTLTLDASWLCIELAPKDTSSPLPFESRYAIAQLLKQLAGERIAQLPRAEALAWRIPVQLLGMEDDALPAGLSVAVLDDNMLSRRFLVEALIKQARASKCVALGESASHVGVFIEHVCSTQPDMVVLDQHLDWDGTDDEVLGSDVARQLRQRGYQGAILLYTASSVPEAMLTGNVDGVLQKSLTSGFCVQFAAMGRALLARSRR